MKNISEKLSLPLRLAAYLLKVGKAIGHWSDQPGYPQRVLNFYIRED